MLSLLIESTLPAPDGPDLTRYVLICGVLVLGIVGLGYCLRRVLNGTMRKKGRNRSLEIVDVLPLSPKQRMCVVRCYDRCFLVGVGDKEVTHIAELDTEEVLSPSPNPLVAAVSKRVSGLTGATEHPGYEYEDRPPVVRPLNFEEQPVSRPTIVRKAAPAPEVVQARAPFRDLLSSEGVQPTVKKLRKGGLIA